MALPVATKRHKSRTLIPKGQRQPLRAATISKTQKESRSRGQFYLLGLHLAQSQFLSLDKMENQIEPTRKTEIIAFASGKGGTGKTLMCSCLGYALLRGGQKVLMIDADPATDGLSLFLLGPKGMSQVSAFGPVNTFTGLLSEFQRTGTLTYEPHPIHRSGSDDHGVSYEAIISGRRLYGDEDIANLTEAVPDLDQSSFRAGIRTLFDSLRQSNNYDYVLVDTRGGFAFESTDVCALADSFIVVTEPDVTSFYQDRNLVKRISRAAQEVKSTSVLRAIIVNRAVERGIDSAETKQYLDLNGVEQSFRLELTKEFPVRYNDTHPVPADLEVLMAYKTQRMPYIAAPSSLFSFATLTAFSDIMQVVTSRWSEKQVEKWNELIATVSQAITVANTRQAEEEQRKQQDGKLLQTLRDETAAKQGRIDELQREMSRMEKAYERELERSNLLLVKTQSVSRLGEVTDSSIPEPAEQKNFSSQLWRHTTLITAVTFCFVALLVAAVFSLYRSQRQTALQTLYDTAKATPLRTDALETLIKRYNLTHFDGIDLHGMYLSGLRLPFISLQGANLQGANLQRANLQGADLSQSILEGADLSGARLVGANLSGANLRDARLNGSDLTAAKLNGTDLQGADLLDAVVTSAQLKSAVIDQTTRNLPTQVRPPMK